MLFIRFILIFSLLFIHSTDSIQPEHEYKLTIGIDLGTSFTRFGIVENGAFKLLGEVPSTVEFIDDGRVLIGEHSSDKVELNSKNKISNIKRLIGLDFNDETVRNDIKYLSYTLAHKNESELFVTVLIDGKFKSISIESIITRLINKVKQLAEQNLGKKVTHAIVTASSCFGSNRRRAIIRAVSKSTLSLERLLSESTATAITYFEKNKHKSARILVLELGSGHFDASLIQHDSDLHKINVIAAVGDSSLGGQDFTNQIIDYVADTYSFSKRDYKLRPKAEQVKKALSIHTEYAFSFDDVSFKLSRHQFEEMNSKSFEKIHKLIQHILSSNDMSKSDIDEIMLTGQSFHMPKLIELIQYYFDKNKLNFDFIDSTSVTIGAAFAAFEMDIFDLFPFSIGYKLDNGEIVWIVDSTNNSEAIVPFRKTKIFTTSKSNAHYKIEIFEQKAWSKGSIHLLERIMFDTRQTVNSEVEVIFYVDLNGILNVSVMYLKPAQKEMNRQENTDKVWKESNFFFMKEIKKEKKFPVTLSQLLLIFTPFAIGLAAVFYLKRNDAIESFNAKRNEELRLLEIRRRIEEYFAQLDTIRNLNIQTSNDGVPPASEIQIKSIPNIKATQAMIDAKEICPICQCEYELNEKLKRLPCSHYFHCEHIVDWLKIHADCPNCRESIFQKDEPSLFDN